MRRRALYALSAMIAAWKKAAKFDYDALKKTVNRSADLTFRAVILTARGELAEHEGRPALNVIGTNELFLLADDGKEKANGETPLAKLLSAAKSGRKVVIVTGQMHEPTQGQSAKQPQTLVVERFEVDVNIR